MTENDKSEATIFFLDEVIHELKQSIKKPPTKINLVALKMNPIVQDFAKDKAMLCEVVSLDRQYATYQLAEITR